MTNVYFGNEGLTSTSANFYANIAKEMVQQTEELLNGVKFYQISISAIGSPEKQLMSQGITDISFIEDALTQLAEANAFCAWIREAIKEKEAQQKIVVNKDIYEWMRDQDIETKERPEYPKNPKTYNEIDVINTWDINKRNKYLKLEAFAATIGKYIHPSGAYSKARINMHKAINNPITKEGQGRDLILYYSEATVDPKDVDTKFLFLQDWYRSYEKELNSLKAELKEEANKLTVASHEEFQVKLDAYNAESTAYNNWFESMRSKFTKWKTEESERLSQLKIIIPKDLTSIFNRVKSIGNTSK